MQHKPHPCFLFSFHPAGSDDGFGPNAEFYFAFGVVVDPAGTMLYVADPVSEESHRVVAAAPWWTVCFYVGRGEGAVWGGGATFPQKLVCRALLGNGWALRSRCRLGRARFLFVFTTRGRLGVRRGKWIGFSRGLWVGVICARVR